MRQFALYYLDPVDRLVKEKFRIEHYTRYMDDMVLIHENKEYLQNCLKQIRLAFLLDRQRQGNQKAENRKTKSG